MATSISIGTAPKVTGAKRFGINLGYHSYYGPYQITDNLFSRNPGFEGLLWQNIGQAADITASSITKDRTNTAWPADWFKDQTLEILNGPSAGKVYPIVSHDTASQSPTGGGRLPIKGCTFQLAGAVAPDVKGCFFAIRAEWDINPLDDVIPGWDVGSSIKQGAVVSYSADVSPDSPGTQSLSVDARNMTSGNFNFACYADSQAPNFVSVNGTYNLTFKARLVSGDASKSPLYVTVNRVGGASYITKLPALTTAWQTFTFQFTASEGPVAIGTLKLSGSVTNAWVLLDDFAVQRVSDPANPTILRKEVFDRLKLLNPGILRYMDGSNQYGQTVANMIAPMWGRKRSDFSDWRTACGDIALGLTEILVICQALGCEPWYTIPTTISIADMGNLIDYLAGDTTTVYGAKRIAQGYTKPWTSVFAKIHLEFGNEVWNTASPGDNWVDAPNYGTQYGQRANAVFTAARARPSYDKTRFDLIVDGWSGADIWTKNVAAAVAGAADTAVQAGYFFGPFSDASTDDLLYGSIYGTIAQQNIASTGMLPSAIAAAATAKFPLKTAIYETNIGATSGLAPASAMFHMAGLGAGIAHARNLLSLLARGVTDQCTFCLTGDSTGFTNTSGTSPQNVPIWGVTVGMGGAQDRNRPSFWAQKMLNEAILPTMLVSSQGGDNPTWTQTPVNGCGPVTDHYIDSYAFTDGKTTNVAIFNLHRSASLTVALTGAISGSLALTTLTSANPGDGNEAADAVSPTKAVSTSLILILPPNSLTIASANGGVLNPTLPPTSASPPTTLPPPTTTPPPPITTPPPVTVPPAPTITITSNAQMVGAGYSVSFSYTSSVPIYAGINIFSPTIPNPSFQADTATTSGKVTYPPVGVPALLPNTAYKALVFGRTQNGNQFISQTVSFTTPK